MLSYFVKNKSIYQEKSLLELSLIPVLQQLVIHRLLLL